MKLPSNIPVLSYGAEASVPLTPEVRDLLTLKDKFDVPYQMYRQDTPDSPNAWIPRGLVSRLDAKATYLSYAPTSHTKAVVPPQTEDQARVIQESTVLLVHGTDHVIEAPTGFGKTYVGCAVAGNLAQRTLIVVTKNDLTKGWVDTLMLLFGLSASEIGHVQQDKAVYVGKKFVVAMIHSLVCREYPLDLYGSFGLVIFDEVHRLGADYFSQVCRLFPSARRLGLSATPKRSDGKEKLFKAHIGETLVTGLWIPMSPKVLVRKTGWKVPKVHQKDDQDGIWKKMDMKVMPGRMMPVIKAIASSVPRNQEIADFVCEAYKAGRTTLVVSDLIEDHLLVLFHVLVAAGIPGECIGYYHGQVKKLDLEVAKTKAVVLATYTMVGEGTNVPHWDTLVMATPRANVKQVIGRVLRYVEGKRKPLILDLVDDHPVLKNFYFSRLKQYYSVKGETVEV